VNTMPMSLHPQTARRLHNQIERALRHTYGATTGLRILVGLSTREMLGAGASKDQIRQALVDCVRSHALPHVQDAASKRTDEWSSEMLINSMIEWADQVCASTHTRRAAGT
jgi:hypothetical protein